MDLSDSDSDFEPVGCGSLAEMKAQLKEMIRTEFAGMPIDEYEYHMTKMTRHIQRGIARYHRRQAERMNTSIASKISCAPSVLEMSQRGGLQGVHQHQANSFIGGPQNPRQFQSRAEFERFNDPVQYVNPNMSRNIQGNHAGNFHMERQMAASNFESNFHSMDESMPQNGRINAGPVQGPGLQNPNLDGTNTGAREPQPAGGYSNVSAVSAWTLGADRTNTSMLSTTSSLSNKLKQFIGMGRLRQPEPPAPVAVIAPPPERAPAKRNSLQKPLEMIENEPEVPKKEAPPKNRNKKPKPVENIANTPEVAEKETAPKKGVRKTKPVENIEKNAENPKKETAPQNRKRNPKSVENIENDPEVLKKDTAPKKRGPKPKPVENIEKVAENPKKEAPPKKGGRKQKPLESIDKNSQDLEKETVPKKGGNKKMSVESIEKKSEDPKKEAAPRNRNRKQKPVENMENDPEVAKKETAPKKRVRKPKSVENIEKDSGDPKKTKPAQKKETSKQAKPSKETSNTKKNKKKEPEKGIILEGYHQANTNNDSLFGEIEDESEPEIDPAQSAVSCCVSARRLFEKMEGRVTPPTPMLSHFNTSTKTTDVESNDGDFDTGNNPVVKRMAKANNANRRKATTSKAPPTPPGKNKNKNKTNPILAAITTKNARTPTLVKQVFRGKGENLTDVSEEASDLDSDS